MERISKCPVSHAVNSKPMASLDILAFKFNMGSQHHLIQSLLMVVSMSFTPQSLPQ